MLPTLKEKVLGTRREYLVRQIDACIAYIGSPASHMDVHSLRLFHLYSWGIAFFDIGQL